MNVNQISFLWKTSLVLILLLLESCDKHHAKKLAGVYHCKVHYHYEDISPKYIDSFYNSDLTIERKGKYLYIFDYKIHIDSLWKAPTCKRGYIHDYLNVLFEKDSVFVLRGGGGLGGNSYKYYKGKK